MTIVAGNAVAFSAQLEKEAEVFVAKAYRKFRDSLLWDALGIIDDNWPVDTGFSRACNLPFVDEPLDVSPDPEEFKGKKATPGGMDPEKIDQTTLLLKSAGPFATVGISTNCIYAPALEHGHSSQNSLMYTRAAQAIKNAVASADEFL